MAENHDNAFLGYGTYSDSERPLAAAAICAMFTAMLGLIAFGALNGAFSMAARHREDD
jgi:hypothetical protein